MPAEAGFFPDRLDQRQLHGRIEDFQGDARKTCAGAHVYQAHGWVFLPGQHAGKRIQEVLDADSFGISDRCQVEFLIPGQQFIFEN